MNKFDANSNNPLDDKGQDLSAEQVKLLMDQHEEELTEICKGTDSDALIFDNKEVVRGLANEFLKITGSSLFKNFLFIWLLSIALLYTVLHRNPALYPDFVYNPGNSPINKNIKNSSPPLLTNGNAEHTAKNISSYPRTRHNTGKHAYSDNLNIFAITSLDTLISTGIIDTFSLTETRKDYRYLHNDFLQNQNITNSLDSFYYNNKIKEDKISAFYFNRSNNTHWDPLKTNSLLNSDYLTSLNYENSDSANLINYNNLITAIKSKKGKDIRLITSYISDYLKTNMEIKKDMVVVIIMTDVSGSMNIDLNSKKIMTNNSSDLKYEPRIEKFKLGELLYRIGQSDSWKSCTSNQIKFVADNDGIIELMVNLKSNKYLLKKPYFVSISTSILSDCR